MSEYIHKLDIELTVQRCYECGRCYAYESNRSWEYKGNTACPHCAQRIKAEHFKRIEELGRTVAALKGALTKAKRRHRRRR